MHGRMPVHPLACQYGNQLFFFVPGDTGNPFVALWQAALLETATLAATALVLLYLARLLGRTRVGYVGYGYLVVGAWTGTLALITLTASTPLACGGAPGSPPLSRAQEQAYHTFLTLQFLGTMTLYLTVLLLVVFVLMAVFLALAGWRGRTH